MQPDILTWLEACIRHSDIKGRYLTLLETSKNPSYLINLISDKKAWQYDTSKKAGLCAYCLIQLLACITSPISSTPPIFTFSYRAHSTYISSGSPRLPLTLPQTPASLVSSRPFVLLLSYLGVHQEFKICLFFSLTSCTTPT